MAADTVSFVNHPALKRPKVTEREPLHPHNLRYGAEIPPASEIDLSTLDLIDGEL